MLLADEDSSCFNRRTIEALEHPQEPEAEESLDAMLVFFLFIESNIRWFFRLSRLNRLLSLSTFL
jgi:hypothetical protein